MDDIGFPQASNVAFTPREIIAGSYPLASEPVVVAQGQVLPRGAVIGRITEGASKGQVVLSEKDAVDGSQDPIAVMAFGVDATGGPTDAEIYVSGAFDAEALTYGDGHDADTVREAFAGRPIFLKTVA